MRDAALECPVSGEDMKTKTIVLTLVLCFVAAAVCFADDAFTGTWKLNEAKSKIAPNAPKNNTVVYEAAGDNVKITVDGNGSDSKPTHDEWRTPHVDLFSKRTLKGHPVVAVREERRSPNQMPKRVKEIAEAMQANLAQKPKDR